MSSLGMMALKIIKSETQVSAQLSAALQTVSAELLLNWTVSAVILIKTTEVPVFTADLTGMKRKFSSSKLSVMKQKQEFNFSE